ncbi:tetrathionate reductase family octaheme c-type cytochrome [Thiohalobacter sp. IOR34]|uniref:tetrathionate reductase family octaheme c-type cytochrome n=1 Tax=Thiohalobacter sp. IOR34 TaxID=3057176 RepID=UPI0025B0360A|nr:tetrathionate reductase family octaheme c-type cytochrome [Thiohalobacter sp. IOR34]WJW74286.1 tetrathionate reductase family octaheme c-type cytochrome [Thiohalobacter sp. IOR34]
MRHRLHSLPRPADPGCGWLLFLLLMLPFRLGLADSGTPPKLEPIDARIELGISEYSNLSGKGVVDQPLMSLQKTSKSTTDHSKLEALQGPFTSGSEVTRACLGCHNLAGHQFMKNKHWTWSYVHPVTGQQLGKRVLINNFCTNARGNEGMCAQCHAGYGWKDETFDFSNQENIDCLVCHESTGNYYKLPPSRGNKACAVMFEGKPPIDWARVAQSVRLPGRSNCGGCHFYGGGGDNVKHGDLSSVLFQPPREVDVHMDAEGLNFACIICHVGEGHQWAGSRYNMLAKDDTGQGKPGMPRQTASCASCHGMDPHPRGLIGIKLNDHVDRVACESCHIPRYARGGVATKIYWDWRTAGRLRNGEGFNVEGYIQGNGEPRHTYKSIKGSFKYGENLVPIYRWFNGVMTYTTIETRFDPSRPVEINHINGAADDPGSRIWPFKRMHSVQPYDKGNNTLVYMHLWGNDDAAFWGNYDFPKAIRVGMEKNHIPYSGSYGFVESYSYWPLNHMVAPKEDALACRECHARDGRLSELGGFYLPGRDAWRWLDLLGLAAVGATLLGVAGHGALRILIKPGGKSR